MIQNFRCASTTGVAGVEEVSLRGSKDTYSLPGLWPLIKTVQCILDVDIYLSVGIVRSLHLDLSIGSS